LASNCGGQLEPIVELPFQGSIAQLGLRRPDKSNPLDRDMVAAKTPGQEL
jgi:enoyl-CoA hydratase/carnithine racemase